MVDALLNGKLVTSASKVKRSISDSNEDKEKNRSEITVDRQRALMVPKKTKLFKTRQKDTTQVSVTSWNFRSDTATNCPFFFTNQGTYILVFNLVTFKQHITSLDYWLQQIRIQTQTSIPPADIFLVGTHRDDNQCNEEYITYVKQMLGNRYPSNRYPQITGVYPISNKTGKGITTLVKALEKSSSFIQPMINPSWLEVHHHLLNIKSTSHYISWEEYIQIATRIGVPKDQINDLTSFLYSTSTILSSDDLDKKKSSIVILDPLWLAKIVTSIRSIELDSEIVEFNTLFEKLDEWNNFTIEIQNTLINILTRYYVIYRMKNNRILCPWIIPETIKSSILNKLWPRNPPNNVIQHGRIFDFAYIPLGFLERVISNSHLLPNVKLEAISKNQILFSLNTQKALVSYIPRRIDQRAYQYQIQARTDRNTTEEALLFISLVHQFECIIETYYSRLKSTLTTWVLCSHCIASERFRSNPYMFRYGQCVSKVITSKDAFLYCRDIRCPQRAIRIDIVAPDITLSGLRKWVVNGTRLKLDRHLGEGATGEVDLCILDENQKVAVKVLSTGKRDFLDEEDKISTHVRLYHELTHEIQIMTYVVLFFYL